MADDDDLFRPLSAKVLPKSARYTISGREIPPERALQIARKRGVDTRKVAKWPKVKNGKGGGDAQA